MAVERLSLMLPPPLGTATYRFDSEALYLALDKARRVRRLSWRAVLREAGVPGLGLITRLSREQPPDVHNLVRLLLWLGDTDIKPYLRPIADSAPSQTAEGGT